MSCELVTIRTAYEDEAMSPEQIAESQDLDLAAVKAALMHFNMEKIVDKRKKQRIN